MTINLGEKRISVGDIPYELQPDVIIRDPEYYAEAGVSISLGPSDRRENNLTIEQAQMLAHALHAAVELAKVERLKLVGAK
jgi:hypothetical protein